jgi:hypothetical protein
MSGLNLFFENGDKSFWKGTSTTVFKLFRFGNANWLLRASLTWSGPDPIMFIFCFTLGSELSNVFWDLIPAGGLSTLLFSKKMFCLRF